MLSSRFVLVLVVDSDCSHEVVLHFWFERPIGMVPVAKLSRTESPALTGQTELKRYTRVKTLG
jgi:hypothetical protein